MTVNEIRQRIYDDLNALPSEAKPKVMTEIAIQLLSLSGSEEIVATLILKDGRRTGVVLRQATEEEMQD